MDLQDTWTRCFAELGAAPPEGAFADVTARYGEPHRAYHTVQHLHECMGLWRDTQASAEIGLALFYHDAIYDTHAADNEERSAQLAVDVLSSALPQANIAQIGALILATKHAAAPETDDAKLLVDIDLAILGAEPARFDEYERQVRVEYGWVSDDAFREGRARILRHFLERPVLYSTADLRRRLERRARNNLWRSLAALV